MSARRTRPQSRSVVAFSPRRDADCLDCGGRSAWIEDTYAISDHGCTWLGIVTFCPECKSDNTQEAS